MGYVIIDEVSKRYFKKDSNPKFPAMVKEIKDAIIFEDEDLALRVARQFPIGILWNIVESDALVVKDVEEERR